MSLAQLLDGQVYLDIDKIVFRKCTREWQMQPNRPTVDNLTYVYSGEIDYTVEGRSAHLLPGALVYVPRGTLRHAETPEHNRAQLFSFDLTLSDVQRMPIRLPLDTFTVLGLRQELILLCRQCCNEWIRQLPGYRLKTNGYMLQLLHAILSEEMPDPTAPSRDKRILNLMTYILEHSDEKLQLQDFARELGLSPVYLGMRFKRVANERFSQYVMQCRLNRAEDLLSTGQYTALEVMLLCGFNDYSYFSRAFKRRFNIPPGQYKRQERELPIPPLPDGSDAREDR